MTKQTRPKIHAPTFTDTDLINEGPDMCVTGPCIRWRCRECDYILYGDEDKPSIRYCPMCGRGTVNVN